MARQLLREPGAVVGVGPMPKIRDGAWFKPDSRAAAFIVTADGLALTLDQGWEYVNGTAV